MSYSSASATASTGLSELTNSSPLDDVDVPAAYWDLIKSDLVHIVQEDRIPTAIDYELLNWRSFADPLGTGWCYRIQKITLGRGGSVTVYGAAICRRTVFCTDKSVKTTVVQSVRQASSIDNEWDFEVLQRLYNQLSSHGAIDKLSEYIEILPESNKYDGVCFRVKARNG